MTLTLFVCPNCRAVNAPKQESLADPYSCPVCRKTVKGERYDLSEEDTEVD